MLIPHLVHIFNLSFDTGLFPKKWKKATFIPLFKGGKKTEVGNNRPISLLPLPGKIVEKVVHANLSKFLNDQHVLTYKQGGFRKGFSTASTIADLTDDLFNSINQGQTSLAVFIDLKKAFDTVDHNILVKKLELYGVRGNNLEWCRDYLHLRNQTTLANNVFSSCSTIACGVPQGSVLGPLFFILYVNDIQHVIKNSKVQLYADDTVIHTSGVTAKAAAESLQSDLDSFSRWCNSNKLSLNVSKTKLMIFGTRQRVKKAKNTQLFMNNQSLQRSETKCPKLDARRSAHLNNFMYNRSAKWDLLGVRQIRTRAHDAPLFKVAIPRNETYKRLVAYSDSTKWNALPVETRNIKSVVAFKSKQKRVMLGTVT